MIFGNIPEKRYERMNEGYEIEQRELEGEIIKLRQNLESLKSKRPDGKKFLKLMEKYEDFDSLCNKMVEDLVDKIIIHERDKKWQDDMYTGKTGIGHFLDFTMTSQGGTGIDFAF